MRCGHAMLGVGLALCTNMAVAAAPGFDWLAGRWCGEGGVRQVDEVWLPEAGGALLGMSRTVRDGRTESFEFMRIVTAGDRAGFHVQPNGVPPTAFAIAGRGTDWVRFENASHDFPNRIEYRREGDALHAWIAGAGRDGKEMKIPYDYRRCGD